MISKKANFKTGITIGAILLIAIAVFLNRTVGNLGLKRFDLTQDRIYTISDGAKHIMESLQVPVQVKYYVTPEDELPAGLKTLGQDVTDKLAELAKASRGRLEYQIVNPNETEDLAEALQNKGIRPFQVQSVERDAVAVKLVYSSIAIGYKDESEEILPQVLPDNLASLEYELLSRIVKMTRETDPVVAMYSTKEAIDPQIASFYLQSGQPLPEPPDAFAPVPDYLRSAGYDVRRVDLAQGNSIPDDAQTVLLLGARELNDRQRYEIYRVLRRGGNVIVATQSTAYDYAPGPRGGFRISIRPQTLGINDLLSKWGVRIDDRPLMDEQMATLAIPSTKNLGGIRFQVNEPVQAPMQIRVLGETLNRDLPFVAGVPELLYLWGNELIVDDASLAEKGLSETTLFTGSDHTWTLDKTSGPLETADLDPEAHALSARPPLAVLIEGTFPDPWEGQDVPAWPAGDDAAPEETEEQAAGAEGPPQPGRLLVIGCSKLFEDMLLDQAGHSLFLLNSVDALTLGDDLISIRSKNFAARTFGEVSDGKKLTFRVLNTILVPALLIVLGFGLHLRRRREAEEYAESFAQSGKEE
ncbi:MAG: GldG family protein [Gemmatimonadetes bacterium]|nr:GldG family protein [Gemmatimonadota bacterium]